MIAIIAILIGLLAARRPEGPRGRQPDQVRQQPEAARPGRAQLPRRACSISRPASAIIPSPRTARSAPTFSTCCRTSSKTTSFAAPSAPCHSRRRTDRPRCIIPGNNNVYSRRVAVFLCPSDPSVGPDGVVTINGVSVRRVLLRAQCPGDGESDLTTTRSRSVRRARPASPTSRTARRTPFSMPRNMPAAPIRPWRRRSGTAARRGRTARPARSPGCRRP